MRTVYTPDEVAGQVPHPVATVGNFDGVHRGHQRILETVVERARSASGTAVVITFSPHPQRVLHPDSAPRLIATPAQKLSLLAAAGIDLTLDLPFTRELAALSPAAFVERNLRRGLQVKEIHIGRNFRFGWRRQGDFQTLEELGRQHGFLARAVDGVRHGGDRISSSRVRAALAAGEVGEAAALLGRPPALTGMVVQGDQRGRRIGFPTANLSIDNELIPLTGVYVTRFAAGGRPWLSLTNIGSRPTFPGAGAAVESHLLDFQGDLYGKAAEVQFLARLRDEMRFSGIEALQEQIRADADQARALFPV